MNAVKVVPLVYHFAYARRTHQALGLALLDLDHFKYVNDHYGHAVGDKALAHVALQLRTTLRPYDLEALVAAADQALYQAKDAGCNCVWRAEACFVRHNEAIVGNMLE